MVNAQTFEGEKKAAVPDEAIILLGHGSRVPDAGKDMERVSARLQEKYGYKLVEVLFHVEAWTSFPGSVREVLKLGASKVLVIPYFLHSGLHLVLDLPEMLQEQARRFPGVTLRIGGGLGSMKVLVDLIQTRIEETRSLRT